MILVLASNLIFLLVGIVIGVMINIKKVEEVRSAVQKALRKVEDRPGTIRRPSAETVRERGTVMAQTKDAMREVLQNDPYLNETKR